MTSSGSKSLPTLGFLTVVEHSELGWTGGYLVLNFLGRPLEFHCTAPVKPNRAQEILYGPTLRDFLYGEQIGQTLLEKSHFQPLFVCTDLEPVLSAREATKFPVALLVGSDSDPSGRDATNPTTCIDAATPDVSNPAVPGTGRAMVASGATSSSDTEALTCYGGKRLRVSSRHPADEARIRELWQPEWSEFDFAEPFERIRDAISEAQKAA